MLLQTKEKARGDEKKMTQLVQGVECVSGLQSLLGYHFGHPKDFAKVNFFFCSEILVSLSRY